MKVPNNGRRNMVVRPQDLADQMAGKPRSETFRLPIDAARAKAREILNQPPLGGYTVVVEQWRQLPDGRIEFAMKHLPTA